MILQAQSLGDRSISGQVLTSDGEVARRRAACADAAVGGVSRCRRATMRPFGRAGRRLPARRAFELGAAQVELPIVAAATRADAQFAESRPPKTSNAPP